MTQISVQQNKIKKEAAKSECATFNFTKQVD